MALSADTQRSRLATREPEKIALPAAGSAVIYEGALVCINSTGYAVPAANTAGFRAVGTCVRGINNTGGAAGTLAPPARYVEVDRAPYSYAVSGINQLAGAAVYASDDNALTTSNNNVRVGWLIEPDPFTSGNWYVQMTGGFAEGT